jgi:Fe2+ or Zn2+ uptake regulation protein
MGRSTLQKKLIFEAVKELDIHANAEQVYEYVVQKHPSISKATVYRNLSQMSDSGELLNIGSFHGSVHYDHNCHKHYHFACNNCKRVFDIEDDFSDILDRLKDKFDITSCQITFSGLCQECKFLC